MKERKTDRLTVRITHSARTMLQAQAEAGGVSLSSRVEKLIRDAQKKDRMDEIARAIDKIEKTEGGILIDEL